MKMHIGIDWSEKKHDVMVLDQKGVQQEYIQIKHSVKGFEGIESLRQKLGVEHDEIGVGLETAHNVLVDYLWGKGYKHVYVIPPNIINAGRGRYGQSGAKDDKRDAYIIADMLRTDRHRFYPWTPGSELLQQMRAASSATRHWTKDAVSIANRLRHCLLRYHPGLLDVFTWPSPIACHLVKTYPTPKDVKELTYADFKLFLKKHKHTQSSRWVECYDTLKAAYPQATQAVVGAYSTEAVQLADALLMSLKCKQETITRLRRLFDTHPDRDIFASLPGAGEMLAPSILVKFGEDRERFPSPSILQSLAGTSPVTKQSGKHKVVHIRRACDKNFRYFMQQFARSSCAQSPWAAGYYRQALKRGLGSSHAYRCLANRWVHITWKMWQDHKPYDEAFHIEQRTQRRQPKPQL